MIRKALVAAAVLARRAVASARSRSPRATAARSCRPRRGARTIRPARPTGSPPAVTKAAAAEIQTGKVITMSYPLVDGVPLFGSRFTKTILTATSLAPGASFGENELTYMEDTWLSQSHVGTHLDGMGHIGRKDCYYNQTADGQVHQPEQHDQARPRAPQVVRHARRHHRRGEGVPGRRQAQGQRRLQEAVPRQGHR